MSSERYNMKFALAAVRGYLLNDPSSSPELASLLEKPLWELEDDEKKLIIKTADDLGIKIYHFKNSDRQLPRVNKVLGFLKSVEFDSLLDVGSGRGVFLIPFLETFPYIETKSIDILDKRIDLLSALARGGIENLRVEKADICSFPYPEDSVDIVTMLEVLEHIPNFGAAIESAVKMARKYVIVTVPSKEDDNPEHINLLTKKILTDHFSACGVKKLSFDAVPGHLFMIASL